MSSITAKNLALVLTKRGRMTVADAVGGWFETKEGSFFRHQPELKLVFTAKILRCEALASRTLSRKRW
jgi:hypothetical protein